MAPFPDDHHDADRGVNDLRERSRYRQPLEKFAQVAGQLPGVQPPPPGIPHGGVHLSVWQRFIARWLSRTAKVVGSTQRAVASVGLAAQYTQSGSESQACVSAQQELFMQSKHSWVVADVKFFSVHWALLVAPVPASPVPASPPPALVEQPMITAHPSVAATHPGFPRISCRKSTNATPRQAESGE